MTNDNWRLVAVGPTVFSQGKKHTKGTAPGEIFHIQNVKNSKFYQYCKNEKNNGP